MAKYFSLKEFCVSGSHPNLVEVPEEGTPIYKNIQYLMERMDVIREKWGSAIKITSGYRPPKLNQACKGAKNSQHLTGNACDFIPLKGNIMDLAVLIANMEMDWDQMLIEKYTAKNGVITNCSWIHLSFSRTNNRRQILAWNGKQYLPVKITTETKFKI